MTLASHMLVWWLGLWGYSNKYCSLSGFKNIGQGLKSLNEGCSSYQTWWGWWEMGTLEMLSDLKLWNSHLRRCLTYTRCFWWCQWYSSSLGSGDDEHYLQRVQVLWLFITSCLDQQVFWWWLDMALRFERYHLWKASFHLGPGYGWRGQQGRAWTTKIEGKPLLNGG